MLLSFYISRNECIEVVMKKGQKGGKVDGGFHIIQLPTTLERDGHLHDCVNEINIKYFVIM